MLKLPQKDFLRLDVSKGMYSHLTNVYGSEHEYYKEMLIRSIPATTELVTKASSGSYLRAVGSSS